MRFNGGPVMRMTGAFCSWSGGKECSMALYEAGRSGIAVTHLLNMASEDGVHSRTHGIDSSWLTLQAEAIGLPLVRKTTSWDGYEKTFKGALKYLRQEGITTGIFGDIDLIQHREWVERVCADCGITPVLPLWNKKRDELLHTFRNNGFRAVIIAVDARFLNEAWLGKEIDADFVREAVALGTIDLCGEKGEYHTFVYDGPIFQTPLTFKTSQKTLRDNNWLLQLDHPLSREVS
jgi:diphthine-ammonia ligase